MSKQSIEIIDLVGDDEEEVQIIDEKIPKSSVQNDIPPLTPIQNIDTSNTSQSSVNMNKVLGSLHTERLQRLSKKHKVCPQQAAAQEFRKEKPLQQLSVLTYNTWFAPVCFEQRMKAIVDIIKQEDLPDVVMLQEVTHQSYNIFSKDPVLKNTYRMTPASNYMDYFTVLMCKISTIAKKQYSKGFQVVPYGNSVMGRDVKFIDCEICSEKFRFATSHLESPIPGNNYSKSRQQQFNETTTNLNQDGVMVVYGGDMNWDEKRDGQMKIPNNWQDSWITAHPDQRGNTYDGVDNKMLTNRMQSRLDRILFKLPKFKIKEVRLVGDKQIKNLTYSKEKKSGMVQLPVYPSDHFGLLVKFERLSQ